MVSIKAGSKEQLEDAVKAYLLSPDMKNLELVITYSSRLVNHFAKLYSGEKGADEDLLQAGYEGVLKSLIKYDPGHNTKFVTFASHYILGEIKKELNDRSSYKCGGKWMTKLKKKVYSAREKLTLELGRDPSVEEISREVNLTKESVRLVMMAGIINIEDIDLNKIKNRHYESFQLPVEDKIVIQEAIKSLTGIQKQVIYYIFYQELTQNRVGEILGINQRKVSRVMSKALSKISYMLG